MQLPIMVVTLELNPDHLFISRVHRSNGYQSLREKSLLLNFLQLLCAVCKKKNQYSTGGFFECKPTRSHTTAASTFTFLLTQSPPFPYRVPGLFLLTLAVCARGSYCSGAGLSELPGLLSAKPPSGSTAKSEGQQCRVPLCITLQSGSTNHQPSFAA